MCLIYYWVVVVGSVGGEGDGSGVGSVSGSLMLLQSERVDVGMVGGNLLKTSWEVAWSCDWTSLAYFGASSGNTIDRTEWVT